jgi:F0F1-type ATP synthase assembly protein I
VQAYGNAQNVTSRGVLFRSSAIFVAATLGSLVLGTMLDRILSISPVGTLCVMVLGISCGSIGVYRIVHQANAQMTRPNDEDHLRGD